MNPYCFKEGFATYQSPIDVIRFPNKEYLDESYFFPSYKKL